MSQIYSLMPLYYDHAPIGDVLKLEAFAIGSYLLPLK
jgi:hypothetical protein